MKRYNPKEIEPKWQEIWDETGVYTADLESKRTKYIAMSMFNYPSGAGIHLGHAMNYTVSDVKARFKRQQGYESYHPVGWDSFGLPAENYAIKTGVSPQASMAKIIPGYHKQYKAMGWSNDWEKEIATHLPEYYKWTQWIFLQMHKHGLAYQDIRMQWWCTKCQTVLANEQVIDGKCWRHDAADDPLVEKREIKQWFFKITEYADELLDAIDELSWTESVKLAQRNWIGRSRGINIDYEVVGTDKKIACFTTTPVNYGMTFIVLAPEHPMVGEITTPEHKAEVDAYVAKVVKKTEVERQQEGREKTGVFTGAYVKNQVTGEDVPVWIGDFVLMNFGTGALQGCPAHDERDFEFARKFGLPIIRVVEGPNGQSNRVVDPNTELVDQVKAGHGIKRKMINSAQFDGLPFEEAMEKTMDYFEEQGWGKRAVHYRMRDWSVSRQRYWGAPIPVIECPKCGPQMVAEDELPVILPELSDYQPNGDGRSALARAKDWLEVACPNCGGKAERETDTLDTYLDSSWYWYRYFDPRNRHQIFDPELAKKWEPIDFYNGADHATAHLLYARFIARFFKKLGLVNDPEPFKHFLFNGKITAADGQMFSKSKGNGIDPLEIINQGYGADSLRTYLMFASPLELWTRWDENGVPGCYRFLSRIWNLVGEYNEAKDDTDLSRNDARNIRRVTHQMIKKMTEDIEASRYNTAIAAAMGTVNELYKLKAKSFGKHDAWHEALLSLVACVAPFAPYIAEELWFQLGHSTTVHRDSWPTYDEKLLAVDQMTIGVQVNGKVRAELQVATDASSEAIIAAAQEHDRVKPYIEGKEVKKTVYVPGRLVSLAV